MKILFVCTGNTCRSPMAKAIFDQMTNNAYKTESAGLSAIEQSPASENAVLAMQKMGVDLSGHKAKKITEEMLAEVDIVVPMTKTHAYIIMQYGVQSDKIVLIGKGEGIDDPYGGSVEDYMRCAQELKEGVRCLLVN